MKIKEAGLVENVSIATNDIEALNLAFEHGVVDIVQTTLPYGSNEIETVFDSCKKRKIPIIANQVLRILPALITTAQCKDIGLEENQTIPVLIGSKNPKHVRDNATLIPDSERLIAIFKLIETIFHHYFI